MHVPVIAIDGPSGSGKGTIATTIAEELGWHYLDSGAVYRILAHLAHQRDIDRKDVEGLIELAKELDLEFRGKDIFLYGKRIGDEIRTEDAGRRASYISVIPEVRKILLVWQRKQARMPGLVGDGRDIGSVVFPQADCKIYLTASAKKRAERRFKQLTDKGFHVEIAQLFREISERDERDLNRKISPLKPASDAVVLDTTDLQIEEVVSRVIREVERRI